MATEDFVKLDERTWVRPSAVRMVRRGLDDETLIFVGSCEEAISVDLPVSQAIDVLTGWQP